MNLIQLFNKVCMLVVSRLPSLKKKKKKAAYIFYSKHELFIHANMMLATNQSIYSNIYKFYNI